MTDKEKQDNIEVMQLLTKNYYDSFQYFLNVTGGNLPQAYKLTKDLYSTILNQNQQQSPMGFFGILDNREEGKRRP